ncbi:MAG: cardiolipin synthase [Cellulosilyticum sp.]|nr:cardiolipin synthase [Cellulosilyticum sp.]
MKKENSYKDNSILLLEKGKKGMLYMIFGRFGIVLVSLVIQFLILFSVFRFLSHYVHIFLGGVVIFNVASFIYLLNTEDNPSVKITWLVLVSVIPALGIFLYIFVKMDIGHRAIKNRLVHLQQHTEKFTKDDQKLLSYLEQEERELYNIANYIRKTGSFPVYKETKATYYPIGEAQFEEMIRQLSRAKKFIFLEYFIVDEGYMWGRILSILAQKVKEGVEVRMIYDGTCEFAKLPRSYTKKLRSLGIKSKVFSPIMPFVSTHYNYRDHRKILVIDGKVAFNGGINLADEYINRIHPFGHWKDTGMMLEGPAVDNFTLMFLEMWNIDEKQEDDYSQWINIYHKEESCKVEEAEIKAISSSTPSAVNQKEDLGYVIPYGDDPLDGEHVGKMVYIDILNHAKEYVHIMSPYLILDGEMETALIFAAKRGVDVRIVLPHIPDKKYAFALAKTHYKALLKGGVKIYEYTPGFVHAKVFLSDDQKAVVGTINLDYRSLYHHFECATYLYEAPAIKDIKKDFKETLEKCQEVKLEDLKKEKLSMVLMGKCLKVLAPLM